MIVPLESRPQHQDSIGCGSTALALSLAPWININKTHGMTGNTCRWRQILPLQTDRTEAVEETSHQRGVGTHMLVVDPAR